MGEPGVGKSEGTGTLAVALAQAQRMLPSRPDLAEEQALEILKAIPGQPDGRLMLARALRLQGKSQDALGTLQGLTEAQPKMAAAHLELGLLYTQLGDGQSAIAALRRAVAFDPEIPGAFRALGDQLLLAGDAKAADEAYARHIKASVRDPCLISAAAALCDGKLAVAERLLRDHLNLHPTDVAAIRMLAEIGSRLGRYDDAEKLLARCLELAPGFSEARANYAGVLLRANKLAEASAQAEMLLAGEPRNPAYKNVLAAALARLGESHRAIQLYEGLLKDYPHQPKGWMSYGHTLKAVGCHAESIAAYRRSVAQMPGLGEAWWSLANLKTFRFTAEDEARMRAQLAREDIDEEDRFHLHFALAKSLEDAGSYGESFEQYSLGNVLRKKRIGYDPRESLQHLSRSKALFTHAFFAARTGLGCEAADPIFILGMPRSGSTLVEQILASHSAVEGTMELPDVMSLALRLGGKKKRSDATFYPEVLAGLDADRLKSLGEEYLARTRIQRRSSRPFFTDKMPNNFEHVGFIHLMLPNAKIIDARRHPLACCFSNFKQHFARGQGFSYDLFGMGQYYRSYVELMAHFDSVLPARVHRVIYEHLVDDPVAEIRRMLDYCGLPFEETCHRFHETERAVRTASSEQVRLPMYRDAVDHWRNFEPWLSPLKEVLGTVLEYYPAVPEF